MRNFFGIYLFSSALIHCVGLFLLAASLANRHEVPVIYVTCWVNDDIAGKNAGPVVTKEPRSGTLRNTLTNAVNANSAGETRAKSEETKGTKGRFRDDTPGAPSSLQIKENTASRNSHSEVGISTADSGGRTAAALPVGKRNIEAFSEYAPKQVQAWRHQFMMNVEAQLHAVKARNYYKSISKSLSCSLASTITAKQLQEMHNQSAVVEIALQKDGTIENVLVDFVTDNELSEVLVEEVDWNTLPLPSRFGLAERVVKLAVTVDNDGTISVKPELLHHIP